MTGPLKTLVGSDWTFKIPAHEGDCLLWLGHESVFSILNPPKPKDYWVLNSKSAALITNKVEDFPSWFGLHPSERSGRLASPSAFAEINAGKVDFPSEPIEGPNIWRCKPGDWLLWLGEGNSERQSKSGILGLYGFSACALAARELSPGEIGLPASTEAGLQAEFPPAMGAMLAAAMRLAGPRMQTRVFSDSWGIGEAARTHVEPL